MPTRRHHDETIRSYVDGGQAEESSACTRSEIDAVGTSHDRLRGIGICGWGQRLFLVSAPPPARVSRSPHLGQPNGPESDAALQSLVALAGKPLACRLALSDLRARCLLARGIAARPGRSVAAALTGCGRGHAGPQRGGLRRPLAALAARPGLSRSVRRGPGRRQQRGSHPCDRRSYPDPAGPPARGDRRAPSAGRLVGQAVGGVRRAPTRLRADAGRALCPAH